jgi:hypothetical protein
MTSTISSFLFECEYFQISEQQRVLKYNILEDKYQNLEKQFKIIQRWIISIIFIFIIFIYLLIFEIIYMYNTINPKHIIIT